MTTLKLPEPDVRGPTGTGTYFDSYTPDRLKQAKFSLHNTQEPIELLATDDFYSWWEENPSLGQQQALVQFYDKQPAPQQKPLTDEQIFGAFCDAPHPSHFIDSFKAGVKFAEQSNFGCDLPAGTKLYLHPAPQQPNTQEPKKPNEPDWLAIRKRLAELEDIAYGLEAILERAGDNATVGSVIAALESLKHNTQEPVGWLIDGLDVVMSHARAQAEQAEHHAMGGTAVAYPIYTHPAPQQKLWQDLTVQEQAEATSKFGHVWSIDMIGIADAISAKLQEKNGHLHQASGVKP